MARKLTIPFGNYEIVAEVNTGNLPEIPAELVVYIRKKNGEYVQDICIVSQQFEYGDIGKPFIPIEAIRCLVWSDSNDEDLTHDFSINIYKEE